MPGVTSPDINKREPGKMSRRDFLKVAGLGSISALLTACAPKLISTLTPIPPEATKTSQPVVDTSTPNPSPESSTVTPVPPTNTPTEAPTETPKVEVRNLAESESKFYDPEFVLRMEMEYKGIKMPLTVGLMKSLVERAKEPIKSVVLNDPTKLVDIAELWMKVGLENYKRYNPGNDNLTLDQYVDLVKDGGGLMTVAGISEKDAKSQKDPVVEDLKFSPLKGYVVLMADDNDEFPMLLQPNPNYSLYFGINENGSLVIVSQFMPVLTFTEQRGYADIYKQQGTSVEIILNAAFSLEVARAAIYPIYGKNKCLVAASKTQYRNGGEDCGFFGNDAEDFQKSQYDDILLAKWIDPKHPKSILPMLTFSQK